MTEALDLVGAAEGAARGSAAGAATIPVRYAREALARLRLTAAARERILRAAGIPREVLGHARHRITPEQFAAVYRGAVAASGDESLGYAARPVPPGAYAFLVLSLTRCTDLRNCLEQSSVFYRLFDPGGGWRVEAGAGLVRLRLATPSAAQRASILHTHSMLLAPSRTSAWLAGQTLPLAGGTLPARFRSFAAETRYLFGVVPDFGEDAEIRFAESQLALPVTRAPAEAASYLRSSLHGLLLGAAADETEQRVRRVLAQSTPFAGATVDQVGRALGMSRQTLARRLQRVGTSFAALREELRRDLAIGLLDRGLRLTEVAERLGYSEPSAFQRAFKTWTGSPPGRYARAAGDSLRSRRRHERSAASVAATSSSVL